MSCRHQTPVKKYNIKAQINKTPIDECRRKYHLMVNLNCIALFSSMFTAMLPCLYITLDVLVCHLSPPSHSYVG